MGAEDRINGITGNIAVKVPCKAATTANITLSGEQTIDGVACVTGDRVLVKNQTSSINNGIYNVSTGAWTRTKDFNGNGDIRNGTLVLVTTGSTQAINFYRAVVTEPAVIGTSAVTFVQTNGPFSGTYQHPAAGSVAAAITDILRGRTYPLMFGATGDGVADDTAELQACIDGADGRVIDLQGLTYKVATTLSLVSDTTIINGTISFATASDTDCLFEAFGSTGTQYTPSAAPVKGDTSIAITGSVSGLAVGDWCYLRSTDDFSSLDSGKRGEWVRILSIASLTLSLEQRIRHTYTTSFILYKPTLISNITLDNLRLIGNGFTGSAAQFGLRAYLCKNVNITRCSADSFGSIGFSLETVLGGFVTDCTVTRGNHSGNGYGVAVGGGCDSVTVKGSTFRYLRHGVTVGATYFTDYNINVVGNTTFACSDAGIDVHPNAMSVVIANNNVDCYTPTVDTGDGIIAQAAGVSIIGNIVRGWLRIGILAQPLTSAIEADDAWVISNNIISSPRAVSGANGITFSNEKGTTKVVRGLVIANNVIQAALATTGKGISIFNTTSGGPIRTVTVNGNTVYCRDEALLIQSTATDLIDDVAITGNSFVSLSAAVPSISLVNGGTGGFLTCITVAANTIRGGTYGISSTGTAGTRINRGLNVIQGFSTAATVGTFASSNGDDVTT